MSHDSYLASGIDYEVLDRVKRESISLAAATSGLLAARGGKEHGDSRGSSAYVFDLGGQTLALVIEGLGTKSLIAEQYLQLTGESRFADVAIDAVGAIVNDVVSVGALPVVVAAYFATGDAAWYSDERRSLELLAGWQRACRESGATWGGGESPALPGLLNADGLELAGTAVGVIPAGRAPVLGADIRPGEQIVLLASSGLHANGASLARRIAGKLPEGYLTKLPSGRTYGDALLAPSLLYARFVEALVTSDVRPSFLNGITGHGIRKLMRAPSDVRYVIERLPDVPEVLAFLVEQAAMSPHEAYGTLNMGSGFVAVVPAEQLGDTLALAEKCGLTALHAGHIEPGPRSVELPALGIRYGEETLDLGTRR